ncbi:hypothetical protein RGQ29_002311 [Quercus rubra]|uniref:Uncharacterized protein n=1 Tax=Quercus rubra TaxID=3512 RepID=A0AAN7I647_QUERU|nr:hypothetical protein RGQ29_002311 [Quercus rubra]
MFDKLERIPKVTNIELYIQLELRAVWQKDIQQTITSLQVTVPDAQYEYSAHVEDDDVHADGDDDDDADDDNYVDETTAFNNDANDDDDDDDDDYVDETIAVNNDDDDDDDDYVDENIAINSEDFVDRDEYEDRIDRGDFRDFEDFERDIDDDETLDGYEPNADNVISVQNITNTIPAYEPLALSFFANIWENKVDPSHIEMPFVSTWREGMNLCKWLIFANKVEV